MDVKRYGPAAPFRYVIIPESVAEVEAMIEANERTATRNPKDRRVAAALGETLRYALAVEREKATRDLSDSFNGVVVPEGVETERLNFALHQTSIEIDFARLDGSTEPVTANDDLLLEMRARVAEAFAM